MARKVNRFVAAPVSGTGGGEQRLVLEKPVIPTGLVNRSLQYAVRHRTAGGRTDQRLVDTGPVGVGLVGALRTVDQGHRVVEGYQRDRGRLPGRRL